MNPAERLWEILEQHVWQYYSSLWSYLMEECSPSSRQVLVFSRFVLQHHLQAGEKHKYNSSGLNFNCVSCCGKKAEVQRNLGKACSQEAKESPHILTVWWILSLTDRHHVFKPQSLFEEAYEVTRCGYEKSPRCTSCRSPLGQKGSDAHQSSHLQWWCLHVLGKKWTLLTHERYHEQYYQL